MVDINKSVNTLIWHPVCLSLCATTALGCPVLHAVYLHRLFATRVTTDTDNAEREDVQMNDVRPHGSTQERGAIHPRIPGAESPADVCACHRHCSASKWVLTSPRF